MPLLAAADYIRVAAPAFDKREGSALWRDLKEADGSRAVNLVVILPDAQVHLINMLPPKAEGRALEQVEAVDLAGKLLKL